MNEWMNELNINSLIDTALSYSSMDKIVYLCGISTKIHLYIKELYEHLPASTYTVYYIVSSNS